MLQLCAFNVFPHVRGEGFRFLGDVWNTGCSWCLAISGLLHAWKPGMFVAFVSHQWLGNTHPDPTGKHCCFLRETLKEVLSGSLAIESDIVSQNRGADLITLTPRMRRQLADGYLFLDWFAIPQITARLPGVNEETCRTEAAQAVQSIPAYVEASDLFIALVPEVKHQDRGCFCNYTSWLQRGWCRAELWCRLLSNRPDTHVILLHSTRDVRYMFPLDWQLNTIVDGQFTVEEDRLVVAKLGEAAVDAKIQSLKEQRAMCIFRWFVANRARLLGHDRWNATVDGFLRKFDFANWDAAVFGDHSRLTGLLCAMFSGDTEMMRTLASCRADINKPISGLSELGYYESQTLLMAAAKSKQTGDVLETIIELRADISVRSSNGSNVMFLARTPEQVSVLFAARADLHSRRGDMMLTPLTGCATMACTNTVRALLEVRCDPKCDIQIPIMFSRGNPYSLENLRLLPAQRADPNSRATLGGPSYTISYNNSVKMSIIGWERSSVWTQYQALLIDCTPLHAAAYVGDQAITRLLWEHGAEQKTNFMEMLPEEIAEKKGYCHLLPILSSFFV